MVSYIESFIMKKQQCVGVFLDISAAFDSIKPSFIKERLLDHEIEPDLCEWYYKYITQRIMHLGEGNEKVIASTASGFPLGGVCSALFWTIAFDPAIHIINKYGINGNGFADDSVLSWEGMTLVKSLLNFRECLTN